MSVVIHSSMGKTRYELSDYILNCSEDELYEICRYYLTTIFR